MSGFDPSRFLKTSPAGATSPGRPDGTEAEHIENKVKSVASVAENCSQIADEPFDPQTGEIITESQWQKETVAAVATVATLPDRIPFSEELNRMFHYPLPDYVDRHEWREICMDARRFAEDHAEDALAAGWEPLELFGCDAKPWHRSFGIRPLGVDGLVMYLHGRGIGSIEPHAIEIINRIGPRNRLYRAHHMTGRYGAALMWDAFHPANKPPPDPVSTRQWGVISRYDPRLKSGANSVAK